MGDPEQIDHPYLDSASNGLTYIVERFKQEGISGHIMLEKESVPNWHSLQQICYNKLQIVVQLGLFPGKCFLKVDFRSRLLLKNKNQMLYRTGYALNMQNTRKVFLAG